jgi:citrate lyase subunit beta/citryl-CoA lyase
VVLPKVERPSDVPELRRTLATLGLGPVLVLAGLETAAGVADARLLAASGPDAVYFGAEDYIADLGGRRTTDGAEVLFARSTVCLAARLAGIPALDQVVVEVRDDDRFLHDAQLGRSLGYTGKLCVHPAQVALAHRVFSPSPEELAHARAVLEAGAGGVGVVDGHMIDEVHVRLARQVLERADP